MDDMHRFAAVVLVYRNADDLVECIQSMREKIPDCVIVVVNAYYDEPSRQRIEGITRENDCVFINIENRGYSFGNNRGIEYVLEHFHVDYIIISNPDIIVKKFSVDRLVECPVIAPMITAADGRAQNPAWAYKSRLTELLVYEGYLRRSKMLLYAGVGITKVARELFLHLAVPCMKAKLRVYEPHGSFIVIKREVVERLVPIFDENMFLFGEEALFAWKMEKNHFPIYYTKDIQVLHKEDGSMKLSSRSLQEDARNSMIYYYTHYGRSNGQTK